MKKNNLFKAIGFVILLYILISWIVPVIYGITGTKAEVGYQIGFVSIVSVIANTFSGFGSVVFFVFLVGGFYGVLKATGAYDKMMTAFSKVAAKHRTGWLIGIIVGMTLIASISGLDLGLLIVYPFLIGLILKLGYDKLVALAATVGATIVGMYGALFANTMYGLNVQVLTGTKMGTGIVSKIILLAVGLGLLLVLTLCYAKKNSKPVKLDAKKETGKKVVKETKKSPKKNANKKPAAKVEKKKEEKPKKEKKAKKERGSLPAFITVGILFLVFILGTTGWAAIFGVDQSIFEKAHSWWTEFTVGGFPILNKLFGGIGAFGSWFDPTRFSTYCMLLLLAMVVIVLFYRKSIGETFEGFVEGIKSFTVPVIITVLVCSVFVFVYYNPVLGPVTELLIKATDGFNVTLASLYTLINSFFYVDYYYFAASTLVTLAQNYTDASTQAVLSVMYVSLYSVVMLVAPTSLILMIGLSISETKYTEWLKFIWILAVTLLLVAFVVLMTMAHLVPLWAGIVIGVIVVAILMAIYAVVNHMI